MSEHDNAAAPGILRGLDNEVMKRITDDGNRVVC